MKPDIPTIRFPILREFPEVVCAVSTRAGGVSAPPFDSLNMGFSTKDDPGCVRENRRRFLETLGVPIGSLVVGQQVHGAHVQTVGEADRGRGALDPATVVPSSDGLATREKGVFLQTISADCPLIGLLAPPDRGVALAHAGWRGVAEGMPGAAVEALRDLTGAEPAEMVAVIAPAIGSCCYVVGDDVIGRMPPEARHAAVPLGEGEGRHRLDLARAIRAILESVGLQPGRIEASPLCSSCDPVRFFSHRRDQGRTGRIAMVIGLKSTVDSRQ